MIDILYKDEKIIVCIKPAGVLSTDEEGGLPGLLRQQLGIETVRTVHRLDRVVSGVMVLARTSRSASDLSAQMGTERFGKFYLSVVRGCPEARQGSFRDLLGRDKRTRMTYVATEPGKDVREALLDYEVVGEREGFALLRIRLHTGRTHQIRVQCASRGMPLYGDRRYGGAAEGEEIALWSHELRFDHPVNGEALRFTAPPPTKYPWDLFTSTL
ncbi:MAG: RluA family pseudouridine synthase [Ruminococcaceae bacterium]|nr:RluA family pseudouridine synthase [Oscillospiraceae bacterium]